MMFHTPFGIDLMIILTPVIVIIPFVYRRTRNTLVTLLIRALLNGPVFVAVSLGSFGCVLCENPVLLYRPVPGTTGNSFALLIEPERFKCGDRAVSDYLEPLKVQTIRFTVFGPLKELLQQQEFEALAG